MLNTTNFPAALKSDLNPEAYLSEDIKASLLCPAAAEREIADKFGTGVVLIHQLHIFFADQRFASALGLAHPENLKARPILDIVHPDDRQLMLAALTAPNSDLSDNLQAFRLLDKNKKVVWINLQSKEELFAGKPARLGVLVETLPLGGLVRSLQESVERYEKILDDADIHLGEIDLEGTMTFVNDAGCRMWNLPREKLIGLPSHVYLDAQTKEKIVKIYRQVFQSGAPAKNIVLDVARAGGGKRTIEKSVSLVRDAQGRITGFRNVTRDITDRVEAEKKLTEHRSRLEAIFRSVKDAIITVDPNFLVIEANKSTEKICGVRLTEIGGKDFSACRPQCSQTCQSVLKQTLSKKTAVEEYRIECDRQMKPHQVVSVSSSPLIDPQGNFLGAVMVIRDVTLLRDVERELRERHQFQNLIGRNKTMQNIYSLLEDLANLDTTVLVTGESGTGKELVARALHYSGNRAFQPFTTVNCSALAESLLESELFGHVKGAFTGAIKDKQGRFAAANGGTILLDEIGDISPMIQLKLLRVLQEKEFERVGESTPQKVDVRVIACTNKDLKEKVKKGEFRQDLYYRLKVVEISLPPLRDRLEDLPLLVDHFRQTFNMRFSKNIEGISGEVLSRFMNYSWPGNVRELEHVMEHAFVLCHGGTITLQHLPPDIRNLEDSGSRAIHARQTKQASAEDILNALVKTGWNKAKAARLLRIGRRTIYRKIEKYQIRCGK